MPSATAYLQINDDTLNAIDRELEALQGIGLGRHETAAKGITRGMRRAGGFVVKGVAERLPLPGYPGDKPELKPLRETLGVVTKQYGGKFVAVVGYRYPAGAHGHAVEAGHRIAKGGTLISRTRKTPPRSKRTGERGMGTVAGFVPGRWDIRDVARDTADQQQAAIIEGVKEAIEEARNGAVR